MAKRVRSPNYPSISLPDAIRRLETLFGSIQQHYAPREVVLAGIGYAKAHGASLTALSAMGKYGLLDRQGEEYKVSERGLMILHPETEDERHTAISEAAQEPRLFADIHERFPGGTTNDDLLRSYLVRRGFGQSALVNVLQSYRETMEFVDSEAARDRGAGDEQNQPDDAPADSTGSRETTSGSTVQPDNIPANPSVEAGKFRVSMTDEFYVDVTATRLSRSGVARLISWLQANKQFVPEDENQSPPEGGEAQGDEPDA